MLCYFVGAKYPPRDRTTTTMDPHTTPDERAKLRAIYQATHTRDLTEPEYQRFNTIKTRTLKRISRPHERRSQHPDYSARNPRGRCSGS